METRNREFAIWSLPCGIDRLSASPRQKRQFGIVCITDSGFGDRAPRLRGCFYFEKEVMAHPGPSLTCLRFRTDLWVMRMEVIF